MPACFKHPEDPDATEESISNVTIQNILLDQSYNDLGFQIGTRLVVLVEAQSTWTVNIVLRSLMYLTADLAEIYPKYRSERLWEQKGGDSQTGAVCHLYRQPEDPPGISVSFQGILGRRRSEDYYDDDI